MLSPTGSQPSASPAQLPGTLRLGPATLSVADRDRSLAFYRDLLGLTVLDESVDEGDTLMTLGAGRTPVLRLRVRPGTARMPRNVTGLYHAAILLPDRASLATVLGRLLSARYPIGASDHLVSEALYLDDPDGNGLEIYRDRPRDEWTWDGDRVRMDTLPLDLRDVLTAAAPTDSIDAPMPDGTTLGHIHLRVAGADVAERYFRDVVGFDLVASMPRARFLSVDRYHHHVGANSWESAGGAPRSIETAGLDQWELILPDADTLADIATRIDGAGYETERLADASIATTDVSGSRLILRADPANRA